MLNTMGTRDLNEVDKCKLQAGLSIVKAAYMYCHMQISPTNRFTQVARDLHYLQIPIKQI